MDKPIAIERPGVTPSPWMGFLSDNVIVSSLRSVYSTFSDKRAALGLSNPGTIDNIGKEVQRDVLLNNLMFSGLRADLVKLFSNAPLFHVSQNLSMSAPGIQPYSINALYGTPKIFMQGNIDNEYQLSGRFNYRLSPSLISRTQMQIAPGGPGQSMVSFEAEYTGADFSTTLKAIGPSILDNNLTGMFNGGYLQSVTPRLALGVDTMWRRTAGAEPAEVILSYAARYKGDDWIGSAQFLEQGTVQATYWKRLSERVEAGIELNLSFVGLSGVNAMMDGPGREGLATMGAKYDFRASSFRGQVDSQGRVSCVFEKRIPPAATVTFAGEMDHSKNAAKVGIAISIESAPEELLEQSEQMANAGTDQQPPPF